MIFWASGGKVFSQLIKNYNYTKIKLLANSDEILQMVFIK